MKVGDRIKINLPHFDKDTKGTIYEIKPEEKQPYHVRLDGYPKPNAWVFDEAELELVVGL